MDASEEIKVLLATSGFGIYPQQQTPKPASPSPALPQQTLQPQPQECVSKDQEEYVKRWAAAKAGKPLPPQPVAQVPIVTAPPPQPAVVTTPPPKSVERLPSGEERLPIGTVPSRRHSVAQLRDLDQRERQR
jgi:hypothetical protein